VIERIKKTTPRKIALSVTCVFIFILAANFFALQALQETAINRGYFLIQGKWKLLLGMKKPVDWLVLGDSSGNSAVVPHLLSETLGGSSVNLCTIGWLSAMNDIWMLQNYRARFGLPKGILIVHSPFMWQGRLEKDLVQKIPLSWKDIQAMDPPVKFNLKDSWCFFLARYFPLYSQNESLAYLLQFRHKAFVKKLNLNAEGYEAYGEANPEKLKLAVSNNEKLLQKGFALSEDNHRALESLKSFAEQNHVPVYLVDGPLYQEVAEKKEVRRYLDQLAAELQLILGGSDWVHYLRGGYNLFPGAQLESVDHTTAEGAKVYTRLVSKLLPAAVSR